MKTNIIATLIALGLVGCDFKESQSTSQSYDDAAILKEVSKPDLEKYQKEVSEMKSAVNKLATSNKASDLAVKKLLELDGVHYLSKILVDLVNDNLQSPHLGEAVFTKSQLRNMKLTLPATAIVGAVAPYGLLVLDEAVKICLTPIYLFIGFPEGYAIPAIATVAPALGAFAVTAASVTYSYIAIKNSFDLKTIALETDKVLNEENEMMLKTRNLLSRLSKQELEDALLTLSSIKNISPNPKSLDVSLPSSIELKKALIKK